MSIPKSDVKKIVNRILSSCDSVDAVLCQLDMDYDSFEVEDVIADDAECCAGCGWWHEPWEIEDDKCEDCR